MMDRMTEEDLDDWQNDSNFRVQDLCKEVRASWKEIDGLKAENEILSVQVSDGLADRIGLVRSEATLKEEVQLRWNMLVMVPMSMKLSTGLYSQQ